MYMLLVISIHLRFSFVGRLAGGEMEIAAIDDGGSDYV